MITAENLAMMIEAASMLMFGISLIAFCIRGTLPWLYVMTLSAFGIVAAVTLIADLGTGG